MRYFHLKGPPPGEDQAGPLAPPPVIFGAALVLGLVQDWLAPGQIVAGLIGPQARMFAGGLLVVVGLGLGLMGVLHFRKIGTHVEPWESATHLGIGGIYRFLRNPMYVGLGLCLVGAGLLMASDWTLLMLLPWGLVMHYGVVRREEKYLGAKFGDAYRAYCERVPRYGWPRP